MRPQDALFFCTKRHLKEGEKVESKYRYLAFADRQLIETMYRGGARALDIAIKLGVHTATIYRELQHGYTGELDQNQRQAYSAEVAERAAQENFKRRGRRTGAHKG